MPVAPPWLTGRPLATLVCVSVVWPGPAHIHGRSTPLQMKHWFAAVSGSYIWATWIRCAPTPIVVTMFVHEDAPTAAKARLRPFCASMTVVVTPAMTQRVLTMFVPVPPRPVAPVEVLT